MVATVINSGLFDELPSLKIHVSHFRPGKGVAGVVMTFKRLKRRQFIAPARRRNGGDR
jgi:hypothetical protein